VNSNKSISVNELWKNLEERMRNPIEFRFTTVDDYALAYIDVIDRRKEKSNYEGPNLPLTFFFSGDGDYNTPWQLNKNDPLVKSISYLFQQSTIWDKFVVNLNSKLLLLQKYAFSIYTARVLF